MSYHAHLLEWPKSNTLATANFSKDLDQWELSFPVAGVQKMYRRFGRQFGSSYKTKYPLIK
jgi:hypothetical protein